jgi:hypothetical protein
MGSIRKIFAEIKWGISPEGLAKKHSWEKLSAQDSQELLNFARYQRDRQQSDNLLVYFFRISRDKDLYFSVEVLSQALQHPAMSSEVPLELPVSPSEKNEELLRQANEIQERGDILADIQLDIHMYQARRSHLFREVQNLEKKGLI